jgi:hypothetical protein
VLVHENIKNGFVVGIRVRRGQGGPIEHECGVPPENN